MSVALTVALPVYNEARILPHLHSLLTGACGGLDLKYEILYVDDGSTDDTPHVLKEIAERDNHTSVATLTRNFGHPAALAAAIDLARGEILILMDADLQDDPRIIPEMLRKRKEQDAEVVYVVRTKRQERLPARILFGVFHWLLSRSSAYPVPREAGSFGLLGPRALTDVRRFTERLRYFPGIRAFVGHKQCAIFAERGARYDRRSRVGLRGLVKLAGLAFFSQSRLPATLFYWLAGSSLFVTMALIVYAFISRFMGYGVASWASEITSIAFFGGITTLGQAFICEYLARIYEEIRGRPVYLIETVAWGGATDDGYFD